VGERWRGRRGKKTGGVTRSRCAPLSGFNKTINKDKNHGEGDKTAKEDAVIGRRRRKGSFAIVNVYFLLKAHGATATYTYGERRTGFTCI